MIRSSKKKQKILFIKLRALGDTVLMTAPLFEAVSYFPGAEIHVCVLKPWATLLENFPGLQRIWIYEKKENRFQQIYYFMHLALQLWKEKYDCVVNFHASPSSARLAFATHAPIKSIHFHGFHDVNRYSTQVIPGKGVLKPIIERDMDTLRALGIFLSEGKLPKLFLREKEKQEANDFLKKHGWRAPILGLGIGASRATKIWPYYAELVLHSFCQQKLPIFVFLGAQDQKSKKDFFLQLEKLCTQNQLSNQEYAEIKEKICILENLPIRQVAALLSVVTVWIGNDSGLKHLAIAVQTPTLSFFGPEHPFEWHPYSQIENPYFFIPELLCRKETDSVMRPGWCKLETCTVEKHFCLAAIGVQRVWETCVDVLEKKGYKLHKK